MSGGVIFGEMCNRCQGTGNSAGETVSPCASIPLFLHKTIGWTLLLVHYVNTVGTASIEHVAVRRRRRVDDEVKLTC